ncbi:histidine kinase [Roseateles asaccharophilus]|uniref:Sensor histidine kinase YesM n=1 Tax=Roseateles asaccharophilus TaxID=582607 RepID=A0ABU2A714_9BURK|nr:histidine kinase [Roseateles asaccharophilus]MDR7332999.1 sensor histidine kinase YesM [Roseateles asaccharophilus]
MEDLTPLQAFRRVCNLRMLAGVYYFCLLYAVSRSLTWYGEERGDLYDFLFSLIRFSRQTLLTGVSLLLMVALAEALLAGRRWKLPASLTLQALAVGTGAAMGTYFRWAITLLEDPTNKLKPGWFLSTITIWTLLGGMAYALLQVSRAQRSGREQLTQLFRERETLKAQQTEAQLSALNAQIEPHFLFNTLANVKRLYETQPERGRNMLVALIAYLRAALPGMRRHESTLADELELVRHYLAILQMRMGERLSFDIDAPAALLSAHLPTLVLPTLVENAIKHGLSPLPQGGHIAIRARPEPGGGLSIEVADNGQGFGSASGGAGVGLANTRARLAARFGDAAALELEAAQPRGVIARVRLPAEALS